ncbi:thioredoxin family protein [Limnoglobus roseus]|uniref:Thioredoxin family protein n=1 Tax=Limnoglobus roseus TaxID=2598579 RepID=A0A5C1A415_9BACT|nr:thioredoxin family protein [Limnoglobus roseus]QEL13350.1 thioredoxin family protein [Limnoglobus roseus]
MPRMLLLILTLVFLLARPVGAQDIQWRDDYKAARKEAAETGKALLLDFGTESCVFCRKLDATTFRDPAVVKRLGERFIAVKLDGHAERKLTAALEVTAYPTIIVATADGKVVGRHTGYLDATQMLELLDKAPAMAKQPVASKPEEKRRVPESVGASLEALYPKIAAALNRGD